MLAVRELNVGRKCIDVASECSYIERAQIRLLSLLPLSLYHCEVDRIYVLFCTAKCVL